jgi:hypothetical protein
MATTSSRTRPAPKRTPTKAVILQEAFEEDMKDLAREHRWGDLRTALVWFEGYLHRHPELIP